AVLEKVGLRDAMNVQLRKFSKGMLQRAGIAQAILHDPKVVFLDEPMSGLDPMGRREVRDLIQSPKDQGKTVFFSTHILSDAESLCDRIAVLHKGELRAVGAVSELTASAGHNVEVTWQGPRIPAISSLSSEWRMTGDTIRAVLPESALDHALELVRNGHARLISVTPMRM